MCILSKQYLRAIRHDDRQNLINKPNGGATLCSGCSQEHPELEKKNIYIYIYIN